VIHVEHTSNTRTWKSLRLVEEHGGSELTIQVVKPHRNPAQVEVTVARSADAREAQTARLTHAPSETGLQKPSLKPVILPF